MLCAQRDNSQLHEIKKNEQHESKKEYQDAHSHKIKNKGKFQKFINENNDKSSRKIMYLCSKISVSTSI